MKAFMLLGCLVIMLGVVFLDLMEFIYEIICWLVTKVPLVIVLLNFVVVLY